MANKVFIQDHFDNSLSFSFPLTKDPMLEVETEWTSFAEVVPEFSNIMNTVVGFSAGVGGEVSKGLVELQNLFDVKRWKKTNPLNISLDLQLFTKDNSEKDVHDRSEFIMNYTMLTLDGDNYIVPGISLASLADFQGGADKAFSSKAKIVCLWIPGIVYLPKAIITKAQPTFSRERTEKGFPLWAEINVQIESITPANSSFFDTASIGTSARGLQFAKGLL